MKYVFLQITIHCANFYRNISFHSLPWYLRGLCSWPNIHKGPHSIWDPPVYGTGFRSWNQVPSTSRYLRWRGYFVEFFVQSDIDWTNRITSIVIYFIHLLINFKKLQTNISSQHESLYMIDLSSMELLCRYCLSVNLKINFNIHCLFNHEGSNEYW